MAKPHPSGSSAAARAERRSGERVSATVEFKVRGASETFSGQTINLSRTGALLWITDERFLPEQDAINMVRFSERVAQELGDGMRLEFQGGVVRDAEVVRVSRKGRDEKSPMLMGCRFTEAMTEQDWDTLGMRAPDAPDSAAPPARRPRARSNHAAPSAGPPTGTSERRAAPRLPKVVPVEVTGDYGSYKGYALDVSPSGALLTIADGEFTTPTEPDQLLLYTKRLGFQFRNGMVVRFPDEEIVTEADVVRVSERMEGDELLVVIGATFREDLSPGEFRRLERGLRDAAPMRPPQPSPQARPAPSAATAAPTSRQKARVYELMTEAIRCDASDLHLKVGSPPRLRVGGRLKEVGAEILGEEQIRAMATELMSAGQAKQFEAQGDLELGCTIDRVGRFRVSVFRQRGLTGLAIRCIPTEIPTIESLGISPLARQLADKPRGLVLVTGPTGSGKSHTLAAMVHHINLTRDCHILTMEDPIEFLHTDIRAHITQREIGRDAVDFASALRRALRQDPDVILVGEMRDLETIALALTAAETGHLVFATLHTSSAAQCPERVIDVFPPTQQAQIRLQLSESLQGVMAQILVPGTKGRLVPVQEILLANDAARSLIRESKTPQLYNVMQTGGAEGMQTLEAALDDLVRRGTITYETAVSRANTPEQIQQPRKKKK
ncbi:MAG: PilT/PilU family type 4a pilus ATPase [Planctomycetota bacterium]